MILWNHLQKIGWFWQSKGWGYDESQGPIKPTDRHIINNPTYCRKTKELAALVEAASKYTGLDSKEAAEGVQDLPSRAALKAAVAVKLNNPAAEEGEEPFLRADGLFQARKINYELLEGANVLVHVRLPKTGLCSSVLCASYHHRGLCDCRPPRRTISTGTALSPALLPMGGSGWTWRTPLTLRGILGLPGSPETRKAPFTSLSVRPTSTTAQK